MTNRILFLTLKVFSATGGIEKVCRVAGKAMYDMGLSGKTCTCIYSMYDKQSDADYNRYFPSEIFRGFGPNRLRFIYRSVLKGRKSNTVILSHINLLLVGWLIKKFSPATKIVLFAHGIEIWEPLGRRKRMMLNCCDEIISVSSYTSEKVKEIHKINPGKCKVLNNCLDPFLPSRKSADVVDRLRKKYGYNNDNIILFTLSRLSSRERYKGYDKVLESMVKLKTTYPSMRYILAGSYDTIEKSYLDGLINRLGLTDYVSISGFIKEEDLVDYFSIANLYVMPSIKEGFGIVFIEAMYYGLPVIGGDKDGSVDALCGGKLGLLVNPHDVNSIEKGISSILINAKEYIPNRELLMDNFSYCSYKMKLEKLIGDISVRN